jgi:branched-chain amino acid transport system permease protein
MDILLQQLFNGLLLGSLYALVALGYTMVYGILRFINFAHGDVLMVGSLSGLSAILFLRDRLPGLPDGAVLLAALIFGMAVCALLAASIERLAYRRLRNSPRLAPLISGIGISALLQTLAMIIWTRNPRVFPNLLSLDPIFVLGGRVVTNLTALATVGLSLSLMLGLLVLIHRTRLGLAMRAVSENPQVASLMGMDPNRVITMVFSVGGALAALAGVMMASNYGSANFYMGFIPGVKAFTAAVLGGIGNLPGAVLGGLLLGLIEALGTGYLGAISGGAFGSNYQDIFAFMVLIAVLVFRPSGLLGERLATRA